MKLKKITLEAFLSYEHEELALEDLTYAAVTGKNGAGKSSIFQGIAWAIFGSTRVKSDSDSVINTDFDSCRVTLEFWAKGQDWKIVRTRDRGKRGGVTLYEMSDEGKWVRFGDHLGKTAQAQIDSLVGLNEEAWRSIVMLSADTGSKFTEADSSTRRQILMSLIPETQVWADYEKTAKQLLAKANGELDKSRGAIELTRDSIDDLNADIEEANDDLSRMEDREFLVREIERLRGELAGMDNSDRLAALNSSRAALANELSTFKRLSSLEISDLEQQLKTYDSLVERKEKLGQDVELAKVGLAELQDQVKPAQSDVSKAARSVKSAEADANKVQAKLQELQQQLSAAKAHGRSVQERQREVEKHGAGVCYICESEISQERYESILGGIEADHKKSQGDIAKIETTIGKTEEKLSDLVASLENAYRTHNEAQAALESIESSAESLSAEIEQLGHLLSETVESLDEMETREVIAVQLSDKRKSAQNKTQELEDKISALDEQIKDTTPVEVQSVADTIKALEKDVKVIDTLNGELSNLQKSLAREKKLLKSLDSGLSERKQRVEDLTFIVSALKPTGVPTILIDSVLGDIENAQNEILSTIPGAEHMYVEFRTKRALKSGSGSRDVLDIIVHDGTGFERPIESFSSGERVRLTLSNMFAMAQVFGQRNPGVISTIMLDEPLGALDIDAVPAFVDVLRQAVSNGVADSILVVSHDEKVIEALPQTIEVTKGSLGTGAKIEVR